MELSFKNAIELLAAFQAFLFAIYLLGSKSTKSKSTIYIAIFLILFGINTANYFVIYFIDPISTNFTILLNTTFYLMPASLYIYTKSNLDPWFKLTSKSLVHLTPFIIINIILIPLVYLENLKENPTETEAHYSAQIAAYIIFYALIFSYQMLSFWLLKQNKQLYFENYSNTDIRRYQYLRNLNIIFTVLFLISAIKNFMVFNFEGPEVIYATNIVRLSLLIFFCWIIFKGLQSPELFKYDDEKLVPVKKLVQEEKKNQTEIDDTSGEIIIKIGSYMEETEAYLDPSLSLHDLSRKTKIPSRELSLVINHHLNKHFFDFVNDYRIEKAKSILSDPAKKEYTVLEILYEVGFNSKSSFNTAFKKQSGLTPTQFRKNSLQSVA